MGRDEPKTGRGGENLSSLWHKVSIDVRAARRVDRSAARVGKVLLLASKLQVPCDLDNARDVDQSRRSGRVADRVSVRIGTITERGRCLVDCCDWNGHRLCVQVVLLRRPVRSALIRIRLGANSVDDREGNAEI